MFTLRKARIPRWLKVTALSLFLSLIFGFVDKLRAQDCRPIKDEFRSSIVYLHVDKVVSKRGEVKTSTGTGFLVSATGFVLTNHHVVRRDPNIDDVEVTGSLGSNAATPRSMMVIGQDSENDVAVLKFNDSSQNWKPVPIGEPAAVDENTSLCSFGFPLDIDFLMTEGRLEGKEGKNGRWYSSIDSTEGESGAPVFDAVSKRVVALKVGERDDAKHISYLIPINLASRLYRDCSGRELLPSQSRDPEALHKSQWWNLTISIVVLAAGVIILRFTRPNIFSAFPYTQRAFYFWLLQWVGFILIWFIFSHQREDDPYLRNMLAAIDIQSVLALGFFFAFFKGTAFQWKPSIIDLLSVFGLALLWNLVIHGLGTAAYLGHDWHRVWIFGSQVLSGTALGLVALAFVWRYRGHGIAFACVTLIYVLLQSPIYQGIFVRPPLDPFWANALAFGKISYALVFYAMFFFQPQVTDPIGTPTFYLPPASTAHKGAIRLLALFAGVIFAFLVKELSPVFQELLARLFRHP